MYLEIVQKKIDECTKIEIIRAKHILFGTIAQLTKRYSVLIYNTALIYKTKVYLLYYLKGLKFSLIQIGGSDIQFGTYTKDDIQSVALFQDY